jgi:hypothetical protein
VAIGLTGGATLEQELAVGAFLPERLFLLKPKLDVTGSIPVARSKNFFIQ